MSAFSPSSVEAMMQSIQSEGVAFSNRYEVILAPPPALASLAAVVQTMIIRCDSATIPGRSFNTVPYRIYGPARNMPVEPIYSGEINLTYIMSSDFRERALFETWMNTVCNPQNFKFEYYGSYVTNMIINVLDRSQQVIHIANVEEVYPKTLGDIQVGYEKDNEIIRQDVTLSFRKYTPNYAVGQSALATRNMMTALETNPLIGNFIPGTASIVAQ